MEMKRAIISVVVMPVLLAAEPVWTEGEHGLWRLQFADGTFLSAADIAALDRSTLTVTCSYDENPRFYLNGTSFWSITGWNDNDYLSRTLTSRHKALLKEGDNVLAVSLMQGWGGGHIDYGFTMLTYDDSDAILQVVDDAVEASGMVYNLCGQRVEHPQYGIYIVKGKKIIY